MVSRSRRDDHVLPVPTSSSVPVAPGDGALRLNGVPTKEQAWVVERAETDLLEQEALKVKGLTAARELGQVYDEVVRDHGIVAQGIAQNQQRDYLPEAQRHVDHFAEVAQRMAERHAAELLDGVAAGIISVARRPIPSMPRSAKKKSFWDW
jgi:hypothetical protein